MQIIRDNFAETAVAKATQSGSIFAGTGTNSVAERVPSADFVTNAETTTSTSYTNLATVGPSVTVTSGAKILIGVNAEVGNNTVNAGSLMSVDISGAHTAAATDTYCFGGTSSTANASDRGSMMVLLTSITPGSSTYTAKYRVSSGTGSFDDRRLTVIPF